MSKLKTRVTEISKVALPRETRVAYLAEPYDGIGAYCLVRLSRGSSSSAMAAIPGSSYRVPQELGTAVSVVSINGVFQIVSMGNG